MCFHNHVESLAEKATTPIPSLPTGQAGLAGGGKLE